MYKWSDDISGSENIVYARIKNTEKHNNYKFRTLTYPKISIPNRGAALSLSLLPEDHPDKIKLIQNVESYNAFVERLNNIPGFLEFFIENHLSVSREAVAERWSEEVAKDIFSLKRYIFETDLEISEDHLIDHRFSPEFEATIEGVNIDIPIGKPAWKYPSRINGNKLIWNYVDIGHDFCISLWEILGFEPYRADDPDEDAVKYWPFDYYDETRREYVEPQLTRIFDKLEKLGYLHSYTIFPEQESWRWVYGKSDGSIDVAVVDTSFFGNDLLMEQISLILWTKGEELGKKPYILTDGNGHQYLSETKGEYGGHHKLKIYGRLDCPNANKYVEKGQYVRNRVFFKDQETAIAAGYRPCARCMPEEYKKWKEQNVN